MSKRRDTQKRLATLDEIDDIMGAMKNLALLETHRLEAFLATQRRALASIEAAAQDFLWFYPENSVHHDDTLQLLVVVGSERGLCGDFNATLLAPLDAAMLRRNTLPVIVGNRLAGKLRNDERIAAFIDGPGVVEEVPATLIRLASILGELQQQRPAEAWHLGVLYNDDESATVRLRQLLPMTAPKKGPGCSHAPLLNLEPARFMAQLTSQYLYAVMHEVFYASLMSENRKRLEHMDSAIRRLEKEEARLRLRCNALRQDEIIEEIEIIMLSAEALTHT